jgi:hypothetical protein
MSVDPEGKRRCKNGGEKGGKGVEELTFPAITTEF